MRLACLASSICPYGQLPIKWISIHRGSTKPDSWIYRFYPRKAQFKRSNISHNFHIFISSIIGNSSWIMSRLLEHILSHSSYPFLLRLCYWLIDDEIELCPTQLSHALPSLVQGDDGVKSILHDLPFCAIFIRRTIRNEAQPGSLLHAPDPRDCVSPAYVYMWHKRG